MARSANQKLKLMYLEKILLENTDETHGITIAEMISALENYGIHAERKSLYDDIELLRTFGVEIETNHGKRTEYFVAERSFQLPELKLIVDSIQSSRFITRKKSDELIGKVESLASKYDAAKLHRHVYVSNRVKSMNESIYYTVDDLYNAIFDNSAVIFQYFDLDTKKNKVLRHNGKIYTVSPFALTYNDENYYLIAYDHDDGSIRHFRVDKIENLKLCDKKRQGHELFEQFDVAKYTERHFGMFGGEDTLVRFECDNSLAGVIIDRFGRDVTLIEGDGKFVFSAHVSLSPVFFGWVLSFGNKLKILAPSSVTDKLKSTLEDIQKMYT